MSNVSVTPGSGAAPSVNPSTTAEGVNLTVSGAMSSTNSVSISRSAGSGGPSAPGPFAASARPLAAPGHGTSSGNAAPAIAHSNATGHTLKLIPASGASVASQGASSGASAIPADQPVDLAARPKSSPSAASPSTPKPVTATLQVPNLSGLIPGGAAGPRSPASTGTVSTGTASIHTLRIPNLSAAGSLRPATVLPAGIPPASRATLTPTAAATVSGQVIAPGLVMGRPATTGGAAITRPGTAAMLLTVPGKSGGGAGGAGGGASVNVVQQVPNKVVLQAPSPGAAGKTASTITGIAQVQSRGSTATTAIIRTPGSATPAYTIRGPVPVTSQPTLAGSATTAIRLTSPSNPGGAGPVQFVPVSMAAGSTLRPAVASGAGPAVSFRPAVSSATINQRPPSASDNTNTTGVGNTVRVTLVQSSVAGGKPVVSQPNYYKPITITSGGVQPVVSATPVSRASPVVSAAVPVSSPAAAPVRIGTIPARAMVPIAAVSQTQPLAVSVTPASHISLPIQQNIISGKHGAPSLRFPASVSTSGKILQMPIVAGPATAAATGQPSGVTIQKTTIPAANSIPRTISLPYGTTTQTISAISAATPGGAAKGTTPRVMTSQPLATITSNSGNPGNLVTITSSISGGAGAGSVAEGAAALGSAAAGGQTAGTAAALPAGSVYVARAPPGSTNPPLAINLTNTGPAKIISQSSRSGPLSLDSNPAGVTTSAQIITSSASTQGTGKGPTPAANLPIQPARFMALPVASSQGGSASGTASGQPATILTNLTAGQQQQQLLTTVANVVAAGGGGGEGGDKKGGNLLLTNSQINSAPSRPGILRRRDGDRDGAVSPTRGDLEREDDAGSSTSGSTTLSATSSPGGAVAGAGGGSGPLSHPPGAMHVTDNGEAMDGDGSLNPSPRKKLRKQQFNTQPWMSDELAKNTVNNVGAAGNGQPGSPSRKRKMPSGSAGSPSGHYRHFGQPHPAQSGGMGQVAHPPPVFMEKPRFPPLINSYRHTWKSRHNHFLRHSDVKVKEDRRPTVNELANQRQVLQKIDGWKVYHLSTQMESMVETEVEFAKKLNALHKRLEKTAHPDLKDLGKVQELIKANLQRSKVVQDSVKEAKHHLTNEIFEHKDRVKDIVKKYVSKRQVKKRELS